MQGARAMRFVVDMPFMDAGPGGESTYVSWKQLTKSQKTASTDKGALTRVQIQPHVAASQGNADQVQDGLLRLSTRNHNRMDAVISTIQQLYSGKESETSEDEEAISLDESGDEEEEEIEGEEGGEEGEEGEEGVETGARGEGEGEERENGGEEEEELEDEEEGDGNEEGVEDRRAGENRQTDTAGGLSTVASGLSGPEDPCQKKRRRKRRQEAYDSDDSFIDDADLKVYFETSEEPSIQPGKRPAFFVTRGEKGEKAAAAAGSMSGRGRKPHNKTSHVEANACKLQRPLPLKDLVAPHWL